MPPNRIVGTTEPFCIQVGKITTYITINRRSLEYIRKLVNRLKVTSRCERRVERIEITRETVNEYITHIRLNDPAEYVLCVNKVYAILRSEFAFCKTFSCKGYSPQTVASKHRQTNNILNGRHRTEISAIEAYLDNVCCDTIAKYNSGSRRLGNINMIVATCRRIRINHHLVLMLLYNNIIQML